MFLLLLTLKFLWDSPLGIREAVFLNLLFVFSLAAEDDLAFLKNSISSGYCRGPRVIIFYLASAGLEWK